MSEKAKPDPIEGLRDDPNALWTPGEVAQFLRITESALQKWRRDGTGPKFVRVAKNRIGYRKAALINFVQEREHQSTSAESVEGVDGKAAT